MSRALASLAAIVLAAGTVRAALDDRLDTPVLRPLSRELSRSVGKSLPIPAASSGITFTFDPKTSAFERDTEMLGQVYLERARPIGRGKLNVSITYQWVPTDRIDGQHLDNLRDLRPIRDPATGAPFVFQRFALQLETNEITTSVTYGVTDDLEVNLAVPMLQTNLDIGARAQLLGPNPFPRFQLSSVDEGAFGVGDLFVRGKYRLLQGRFGDLAAGLVFRLPSGRVDDFQGTGLFEVDPRLYASTPAITVAPGMRVQAFVNAGLDLTPQNSARSEGRYGAGIDIMLATRVTLSVAFLGRTAFSDLLSPGAENVPRVHGPPLPLFGIDPGQPSYYDVSVGARVNLWRDTLFGIANVVVPANQQGVRSSVVPLIGLEAVF